MTDRKVQAGVRLKQTEALTQNRICGVSLNPRVAQASLPEGSAELIRLLASFTEQCATLDALEDIPDHAVQKQMLRRKVSRLRVSYLRLLSSLTNTSANTEQDIAAKRAALAAYLDHGGQEETPGSRLTQSLLRDMSRLSRV